MGLAVLGAAIGGLIDFFAMYVTNVVLFLVVHFVFVRNLDLTARYRRVHPYAFYLSLAGVIFNIMKLLAKYH